jgi:LysM repeat protein
MKTTFTSILLAVAVTAFSQTSVNKTIAVQPGQKIRMNFDYPKLIKVSTWNKNEISITGEVSVNGGENDDAFSLESSTSGNEVSITGEMRNLKSLPHHVTIWNDGQKMTFKTKADYKKYTEEHGRNYESMNWGTDIEIYLEIKVPENMETQVLSTYGTIEIKNFAGPLTAESTYGGVDAALSEKSIGELKVETGYGQFYTNFDFKFSGKELGDFHSVVNAKPGKGPNYSFESKYGNVYLRKAL